MPRGPRGAISGRLAFLVLGTAMVAYAAVVIGAAAGLKMPAAALFVPVVAWCHVAGYRQGMIATLLVAAFAGGTVALLGLLMQLTGFDWFLASGWDIVLVPLAAAAGMPLGMAIRQGWTFGKAALVTGGAFAAAVVADVAVLWPVLVSLGDDFAPWFRDVVQNPNAGASAEQQAALLQSIDWLEANWWFALPGTFAALVIVALTAAVALGDGIARRWIGVRGLATRFRDARPPEWLVFAVIAAGMAALADWYLGGTWVRPWAWNALLAISAVYWLNGFGIGWYALGALGAHPLLYGAVVFMAMLPQFRLAFSLIGLFDTWYAFRPRLRRIAVLLRQRREQQADE